MNPERREKLRTLSDEFYEMKISTDRRIEIAEEIRALAAEENAGKCRFCGEHGFYLPAGFALIRGHCYSHNGMVDFTRITGVCEFCFDDL